MPSRQARRVRNISIYLESSTSATDAIDRRASFLGARLPLIASMRRRSRICGGCTSWLCLGRRGKLWLWGMNSNSMVSAAQTPTSATAPPGDAMPPMPNANNLTHDAVEGTKEIMADSTPGQSTTKPAAVLVIEDEPAIRKFLRVTLASQA